MRDDLVALAFDEVKGWLRDINVKLDTVLSKLESGTGAAGAAVQSDTPSTDKAPAKPRRATTTRKRATTKR